MKGRVKKLLTDKRCGFITGEDQQDYFFHETVLMNVRYDDLQPGREVTFTGQGSQRGLRANEVTV